MAAIRKAGWFFVLAMIMAGWMGALGTFRGVAVAGVIASQGELRGDIREPETAKIQAFLERKLVLQMLVDYGVSPEEAMAKVGSLNESDLHRLASLTDRVGDGGDAGVEILISLAVLTILILIILMIMNKRVVVR